MIYIDEVKNLRLYRKEFLLPRNGKDKKKNNAVFLLTPNFESSKWVINHKLIVNKCTLTLRESQCIYNCGC